MDLYGWVTPQKDLRPAGVAVTDIVTSLWLPPLSNAHYTLFTIYTLPLCPMRITSTSTVALSNTRASLPAR